MKAFVTGVTGYIGGSMAMALIDRGYEVYGLVRSAHQAYEVGKLGITPVFGTLYDTETIKKQVLAVDLIVNAANSDNAYVVSTLLQSLRGSGKTLIHYSGTSVIGDRAEGAGSDQQWTEHTQPRPRLEKVGRVAIDNAIRMAGQQGFRALVVCPTMVFGEGRALHKESIQIPLLTRLAREHGVGVYVGSGENRTAFVHIDDLIGLSLLMLDKAESGAYLFAENGEVSMKELAQVISEKLGFGGRTQSVPMEYILRECCANDPEEAEYGLGSNIRVSGQKARDFGWEPQHSDVISWIRDSQSQGFSK